MYSLKEVLDALQDEQLSAALEKLEAFATATERVELACWATTELNGYKDQETPSYRGVNVTWVDTQGNPIGLHHFSEEMYTNFTHFDMPRGVFELEPLSVKASVFPHQNAARELKDFFSASTGGFSPVFAGVVLTPEMAETLFRRIRSEALRAYSESGASFRQMISVAAS